MKNTEAEIAIFIEEWKEYALNLECFCDSFDLAKKGMGKNHVANLIQEVEDLCGFTPKQMFDSAYQLRKKLFLLGEQELYIGIIYQWNEFKTLFPITELGFITPFSLTLYWRSIPELIQLYDNKGLREAIFVCDNFIENLVFRYPKTLEKFAPSY